MKKFLIVILGLTFFASIATNAYSPTGYDEYVSITFKDDGKLLIDLTSAEIKEAYEKLGRAKFWGWKHYYMNIKEEAVYIGETIFAKSNRSSQDLKIDYNLEEKTSAERTIRTTGSLSGNFGAKIGKINAELEAEAEHETKSTDAITRQEKTGFTIVVRPNHRVVFRVTGDVLVTNGVSKYYIFGITFDKGCWEYIDCVTRYYELYEEEIES